MPADCYLIFVYALCSHSLRDSDGDVQLLKSHSHLTLCVKSTSTDLEFSLYECSAAKKKVEMKVLLFSLWDRLQATRTKLKSNSFSLTQIAVVIFNIFIIRK